MPTFTAIQLDQLLEPKTTASPTQPSRKLDIPPPHPHPHLRRSFTSDNRNNSSNGKVPLRPHISPALYATPEPTPLPDSPTSSFPPSSPFLINHKRRGPRLMKSFSDQNVAAKAVEGGGVGVGGRTRSLSEENVPVTPKEENNFEVKGEGGDVAGEEKGEEKGGEGEDFYDPHESISFLSLGSFNSSSVDVEDYGGGERSARASGTPLGEFYDAWEDLSSDSGRQGAPRSLSDIETELREMRLSLLMEIEKRKQDEEAVNSMQTNWQMLRERFETVGIVLPADLAALAEDSQSDVSPTENICRQVHLARFVSESIGRGIAKAEAEAEMEALLEAKNFEIARLCDRLHYYETMNKEMSHRNQEAVEVARRERQKRRRRQKWIWGSIATAITLGSAALAWSYLPSGKGSSSTKRLESTESDRQ